MKIKSLLAAVSMVAMAASAANALELAQSNSLLEVVTLSTNFNAPLALELDFAGTPIAGIFNGRLTLTSGGNFPAGDVLTVNMTLPVGVTFATAVAGANIFTDGPSPHAAASGSVIAGGALTNNTVSFNIGVPTSPALTTSLNFAVNIGVASCANLSAGITVTAFLSGGAAVEGDAAGGTVAIFGTTATPDVGCASAFSGVVTSDAGVSNTRIALPGYSLFREGAAAAAAAGTLHPLGSTTYTIDPTIAVNAAGTMMMAADIANVTYVAALQTPVGVNALLSATNIAATPAAASLTGVMTGAQSIAGSAISVASTGLAMIPSQDVNITSAVVTFTPGTPDFITSEPGAIGPLDRLEREGQEFGVFDWNGASPTGTVSVYRITGLPPGPTTFTVTLTNSGANGSFTGIVTPDATGEAVITSTNFSAGVPPYGRGDVLFVFETAAVVDVDRLLARNGVVSAFGDGANEDLLTPPSMDGDN